MPEVLSLGIDQLKTHPRNMRRLYPDNQVREMAASIKACNGVVQPLIVTPNGLLNTWYVVDGNLRLMAARTLGVACPELFCRIVEASEAEQLLMMVATTVRYDVDPISEALHYRALMSEHYTIEQISKATGKANVTITNRLRLLEHEPEIQQLVASGRLIRDQRVVAALNSIPDRAMRIKLANKFADDGASWRAINTICEKVIERMGAPKLRQPAIRHQATAPQAAATVPMVREGERRAMVHEPAPETRTGWNEVRASARAMCAACDAKASQLRNQVDEPAWTVISHTATETCGACNVKHVTGVCIQCPGVELLRRLITTMREKEMASVR